MEGEEMAELERKDTLKVVFKPDDSFRPIRPGHYEAILVSLEPQSKLFGMSYEFRFEIIADEGGEYFGVRIGRLLKPTKVNGVMWRWAAILSGKQYEAGKEYDLTELIYKTCYLHVEVVNGKSRIADICSIKKPCERAEPLPDDVDEGAESGIE